MALLEVRNLSVSFDTAAGRFYAVQGVDLGVDSGEVLAIVGEFGLGQVGRHAGGDGAVAADARTVTADAMTFEGRELTRHDAARAAGDGGERDGDDLPGAGGEPQPLLHRRLPDRGDAGEAHRPRQGRPPRPRHRAPAVGRHPRARGAAEVLPAPDVGRPVPAGDDRHRHRLQPAAPDRRRADHGARRDDPEADPRAPAHAAGRARHGAGARSPTTWGWWRRPPTG